MHLNRVRRAVCLVFALSLVPTAVFAQWLNFPTPGIPRLPDGKPNLSAPAPRTPDGKPDLSGIWSGAGPSYRFNIAQDLEAKDIQPWAEELFIKRVRDSRMDSPLSKCLPVSVPYHNFFNLTRIVQTPALTVMLYESANVPPRTIFTDGRDLPRTRTRHGSATRSDDGTETRWSSRPRGSTIRAGSTAPDTHRRSRSV